LKEKLLGKFPPKGFGGCHRRRGAEGFLKKKRGVWKVQKKKKGDPSEGVPPAGFAGKQNAHDSALVAD